MPTFKLLDVVVLTEDRPEYNLWRGQVGTIVEFLGPDVFEVDFSDEEGQSYQSAGLPGHQLLLLRYDPIRAQPEAISTS